MSNTKQKVFHAKFTPQELAEILLSLSNTVRLLEQHRQFLLSVVANYTTEKEFASIRKLLDEQLDANTEKCASAFRYIERERMRSQLAEMEGHNDE